MDHKAPGGVSDLIVLDVEPGIGVEVQVAGMVVMKMRDDHVAHTAALETERLQRRDRTCERLFSRTQRLLSVKLRLI